MKDIKKYLTEGREIDPNYVVSTFPIGKMKAEIDKSYGCNLEIDVQEDVVLFQDEDASIFFVIERVPKKILCPEGMKDFLKEKLGFSDDDFLE